MTISRSRFVPVSLAAALLAALVIASVPAPQTLLAQSDANQIVAPAAFKDLEWRNVGASRGGRVTGFAGIRQEPHTFYAGATGGGVWKTVDAGITWVPVGDGQITTGSIGSIDVASSNPDHVWVGTGSAAIRSNVIIGRGVFKSTDAGRNFQFAGLEEAGQIGAIRIHPTSPEIVWAAASGSPFGPTEERGVFKTTDGGKTWRKTLYVDTEHGARDVEVDWQNPNVLYAATYRGFRKGWDIISGGPADKGGIWKSVDGGETWKKVTAGLPSTLIGKIDLDIARSNPNVVYAMIEAPGPEGGLYRSNDAGESWSLVNNSTQLRQRPFYFNYVNASPRDENTVFVSALLFHKSTDGGKTFNTIPTPHVDNHGMWINPDNPDIFLQVNDGGANVTLNGGRSWSSILNQPHAEYYMVAVDDQYPYRLYVPQQDNTTLIVPSVPPVSWGIDHPAQFWVQASGCETGGIWPRRDGSVVWGACKGEVGRYNVLTGQEQHYWIYPQNRYGHDPDDIKYRFPRQTVIYLSPHDERVVYQASHVVHRSTDEGVTWETISPDLTAREPEFQIVPGNPITRDITGEEVYSTIYSMVESRLERGVLWAGANDGPVHVSRDNGKTWKNVTPKSLPPGGRVQNIEDSPHRKGSAYVAVYRFLREHDLKPYLYRTDDYGETWTPLTDGRNGIPLDHPTRVVREDPARDGLLYAGTEFGFFVSFDNGRIWQPLQQNLPATPVTDIRVHRNDLVISTMGRSLWIMDNVTPLQQLAATSPTLETAHLFQPRETIRYRHSANAGGNGEPKYPPPGVHIDMWFKDAPTADTRLEILDARGQVIRGFGLGAAPAPGPAQEMRATFRGAGGVSSIRREAGMQRFNWDMRHPGPWTAATPQGGGGGPMVVPGKYSVRLTAGGQTQTRSFELKVDPRVTRDGVTQTDLEEQITFLLRVRDTISDARRLQQSIEQAMKKAGVPAVGPAVPGSTPGQLTFAHPLQSLWARVADQGGIYPQPMLISQLSNVNRMAGQADQKIGRDAYDRFNDLVKELQALHAEFKQITGSTQ
ncbi:MAG TPA: hypothetical protein VMO26_26505 [Vicinamibacterales bacterium]|nr:hypothetical protein [Vicinamibacterales bacterium]